MLTLLASVLMLAEISGDSLIHAVIVLIVLGVVFGILWWLVGYCALPEPFNKVARVLIALVAALILIGFLLDLIGHPVIKWK